MQLSIPRLMIAGTASGVGKTTLVCGLLRALQRRGLRLQACKCGPDYIDPVFHARVLDVPSRNLDLFLGSEELVRRLVIEGGRDADLTLIEGAMGYYDGIAQSSDASAYDVARVTQTPVVLVVDARGRALSCAAEVAGFLSFVPQSQIAGVILNRVSEGYYPRMKAMLEQRAGVPVFGFVPRIAGATLESRHLGLVGASEVTDLQQRVDAVADVLERTVNLDGLLELAHTAPELPVPRENPASPVGAPTIAVARDEAFCFCYQDTLALFEQLGARLAYFSPLRDEGLPEGTSGLYLCGGYPELHAVTLSGNHAMRAAIKAAVAAGMPTIAECGGFMYLQQSLEDEAGHSWPMVGALPGHSWRRERLVRFGYATLEARADNLLAQAGETLRAHEFHYWDSSDNGDAFHAHKPQSGQQWDCVVATPTIYAGYPHLYLPGSPQAAVRFVSACARVADERGRQP